MEQKEDQRPPQSIPKQESKPLENTEIPLDNPATKELFLPALGMFIFYVCHDALQEEMFRFPGYQYGWFMTLAEVTIMLLGGMISEGTYKVTWPPRGGNQTVIISIVAGLCIAGSHGFGNTALRYSSYPLKVAFKSCKLVPTMAMGVCLTGRRHTRAEYVAAFVMCAGLFMLTIADVNMGSSGSYSEGGIQVAEKPQLRELKGGEGAMSVLYFGPMLLVVSTSLDSIVPNLQERLLQRYGVPTIQMIFLSNIFMFIILVTYTFFSGELLSALKYCHNHIRVLLVLTMQSFCAYCGLRCYLTVIRRHGGVAGVLLGNARKIMTIILSFIIFSKPCHTLHCVGLSFIFIGVYLGLRTKRKRIKIDKKESADAPSPKVEASSNHVIEKTSSKEVQHMV
mmetsp:Transcript_16428/g.20516  ORF Transcript_16428/g.20516 Transcript_16428/m.20516 type:complete len:395 (-) Transcript_16428:21-1205(-)|eukprot:CAMPEP_0172503460 /NCGR_PEP_ID=MMETSP1066-20121228/169359_1 /TAXON_ID=671091 /ORGANISM="Coscinodiscus wailesii, Strain CCMP2513" /LENGTH=394 /DNA_ID=CAMNT_0013279203 /DNA_START=84 /DNA_END=1268 /DNA_ORIENTATION=+